MYFSKNKIKDLSKLFEILSSDHFGKDIRTDIGNLILSILNAQNFASFIWNNETDLFDSAARLNMSEKNIQNYINHYQFNDPITSKLQRFKKSTLVTDVINHDDLKRTEFFNDFLTCDGLYWGINFYAWDNKNNIGDLRIWRDNKHENFNSDDMLLLDMIGSAFTSYLIRTNFQKLNNHHTVNNSYSIKLLSPREESIANLISQGYSDKEIAKYLAIAPATVRTHINNAFEKLEVSNRINFIRKLELIMPNN